MVYNTSKILMLLKSPTYIPKLILILQLYVCFWREISNPVYEPLTRNHGKMLIFCQISIESIQLSHKK